jgi:large subunit ribosomal protein L5
MSNTAELKKDYTERIAPVLMKKFNYSSKMQIPVAQKNRYQSRSWSAAATADKKIVDVAITELTSIAGQKAVATVSQEGRRKFQTA